MFCIVVGLVEIVPVVVLVVVATVVLCRSVVRSYGVASVILIIVLDIVACSMMVMKDIPLTIKILYSMIFTHNNDFLLVMW